jgi:hypothetical protein
MTPALGPVGAHDRLLARWRRLEMHVRCALWPNAPGRIRLYLQAGLLLARHGAQPPLAVHRRMLQLLLRTARDDALPWFWRSVCLEHVTLPLAQLASHLRPVDPAAYEALAAAVQRAREALPLSDGRTGVSR